jgi:hypothetical protein
MCEPSQTCHSGNKQLVTMYQIIHYKSRIYWGIVWGQNFQGSFSPYELLTLFQLMPQCKGSLSPLFDKL